MIGNSNQHSFHIPVMGTGYTIDTPLKVAHLGISSVISILDDQLIESIREVYSKKLAVPFTGISAKSEDHRARRITEYLNLIDHTVQEKMAELIQSFNEKKEDILTYFSMLPNKHQLIEEFKKRIQLGNAAATSTWLKTVLQPGSIDVNIMTKLDRPSEDKKNAATPAHNEAHAALRGFAKSSLHASIILSAGLNPRLFSYFEEFEDFYPNRNGDINKKIIIKVSDYRSALIQGKFFAKKGIWVSEFRIESGLNCGGHAFATEGHLMGPILNEFKNNREELKETLFGICKDALGNKGKTVPNKAPIQKITAQGGVGTSEEHQFLIQHYGLDSVGWGTPFLLVPEATSVDSATLNLLAKAKEKDLYLSDISPLGVPFNNIRGNSKDIEKEQLIAQDKPGSSCPKKHLALSKDANGNSTCTASSKYQKTAIEALQNQGLPPHVLEQKIKAVTVKSCICVGLAASTLDLYHAANKKLSNKVTICPGPNLAYFNRSVSLKSMVDHIYGRANVLADANRPNMFIKELKMYIDYFKNKVEKPIDGVDKKQQQKIDAFKNNLKEGIEYYNQLFQESKNNLDAVKKQTLTALKTLQTSL